MSIRKMSSLTTLIVLVGFLSVTEDAFAFGKKAPYDPGPGGDGSCPAVEAGRTPAGIPGDPFPAFQVEYAELSGYTDEGRARVETVKRIIELAVNSAEFKDAIVNFTYQGQKTFVENEGMTNEQIYDAIRQGDEKSYSGEPYKMEIYHQLTWPSFCSRRSAIGFTSPDTNWITTYGCKFWGMTDIDVAGHFFHEWLHKVGFGHEYNATSSRPYSVPYGAGGAMEKVAANLCNQ